jgi:hypothetical protein
MRAHTTAGFYADATHDTHRESSADDHYALILSARCSRRCSFHFLLVAETMVQKLTLEGWAALSNTIESVSCILLRVAEDQAGRH